MNAALAALIAVVGTLSGSALTYLFQRRQAVFANAVARSDRLRQDRLTAYTEFAEAIAELRGACQRRAIMRLAHGLDSAEYVEARARNYEVQPPARGAMYRVHFLADDPKLAALAADVMTATLAIRDATSSEHLEELLADSKRLTNGFVVGATEQLAT